MADELNKSDDMWESTKQSVLDSFKGIFPVSGRQNSLILNNIEFKNDDKMHSYDYIDQEKAKHEEKTWGIPVMADLSLVNKETGQVINRSKIKLATLPKLTPRYSFIVDGGEWTVINQWRLKSGVYGKIKENGEYQTEINLGTKDAKGNVVPATFVNEGRLYIPFDPKTKKFKFKYATTNTPLYSVLKALDVSDEEMEKKWGKDIYEANKSKDWQKEVKGFYNKLSRRGIKAEDPTNIDSINKAIKAEFNNAKVFPETTKLTLGTAHDTINGSALMDGAQHILDIAKGTKKPDDVYALEYKHLMGLEDFTREKFGTKKIANSLRSKIRNTIDRKAKVADIISTDLFNKPLKGVFVGHTLAQRPDQVNPLDILSNKGLTTIFGVGGIQSEHRITPSMRLISHSHMGFLDPIHTVESDPGISLHLSLGSWKSGREPKTIVYDLKEKKHVLASPLEVHSELTVLPDQIKYKGGVPNPITQKVKMIDPKTHEFIEEDYSKARYVLPTSKNLFDECTNLIPFLNSNQGNRTMTGAKMPTQAISLKNRENRLVQTKSHLGPTFDQLFAKRFIHKAPVDGTIEEIKKDKLGNPTVIIINDGKNKVDIPLYNHFPLNDKKTFITSVPTVKVGDSVKAGDLIGDTNHTKNGALALGTNLRTAYMSYHGSTWEDACVISESASKKLTSEHLHRMSLDYDKDRDHIGLQKFQAYVASAGKKIVKENYNHLNEDGIVKIGTKVKPGDVLIAGVRKNEMSGQLAMVGSKIKGAIHPFKDNSLVWDSDYEGEVQKVIKKPNDKGYTVYVKTLEPMQIGDKLCYDELTEILTDKGWRFIKDITLDDNIMTLKDGKYFEFNKPEKIHHYPEGGEMYKVNTTQIDLFVTSHHNMYVRKRDKKEFKIFPANEILGKQYHYKKIAEWVGESPEYKIFPELRYINGRKGERIIPELKMPIKLYLILLGAFLSEGNIYNDKRAGNYAIEISQIKGPNKTELVEVLNTFDTKFTLIEKGIRIYSKQLMEYFKQFGHAKDKFIPSEVLNYNKEDLKILFKWLMWGDGHSENDKPVNYTTISKQLADDVQILAGRVGIAANVKLEQPERKEWVVKQFCICKPIYKVYFSNINLEPSANSRYKQDEIVEDYKRPVYCVTVQNTIIYIRRNGKAVFSCNSDSHGAKQIVASILPDHQMPRIGGENGEHVQLLLNPISVAGRINIGQLLETAASKIAVKTGKPYIVDNFAPGVNQVEKVRKDLETHRVSDLEKLYDPETKKFVTNPILTGNKYIFKLKHQVEKKLSVRGMDQQTYGVNQEPKGGGGDGAQAIGQLELYALLAHGARENLKEITSYKAERQHDSNMNDTDYWNRLMLGIPLPPPKPTFAYRKFEAYLNGLGLNVHKDGYNHYIHPLTDKGVLDRSHGEIKEAFMIRGKNEKEINKGLFDPKITGGIPNMPGKGANWCWEGGTLITTSDGDLPIESIVRQKLPTEVLSYNQNKKTLEWKKIINYWENQPNDDFYKIYLDKDKFSLGTGNHKIYTKEEGELEMKNCNQKTGLELKRVLSDAQKQLIYGSLLGDSSIYGTKNKLFRCGHGPKQLNYLKLKAEMLKEFMGADIYEDKKRQDGEWKARSTFILNTRRNEVFTEIYKVCYSDKKKYITKKWLDKIDERGLCFWFLDDGTVTRKKNGNKLTASIATLSFSKEDMNVLSNWLKKKWELNHAIFKVKKYEGRDMGYQICFSSISTKKLLKLIAPYVIPCMSYKVNIFPYEKPCNTCGKGINPRYDNCDTCVLEQITKDMTETEYRKLTTKKAASSRLFERYGGWKNAKKMALGLLPIKLSAAPIDNFKEIRELIGTKVCELYTESAPIGVKNKKLIIKKY